MTITRFQPGSRMSAAVRHGDTVYVSGQVPDDWNGTIEQQTRECLATIDKLLAEAGTDKSKAVFVQVILNSIGDFAAMNAEYDKWIDPANPPARACIEARLAFPNIKVEIIVTAAA
ncbi:RidA family protein [Devosia sp.]|uniref:RidA family protein n=1 Tax=Devosia sp. TaxID=1871048 RepID=UPI003A92A5AB